MRRGLAMIADHPGGERSSTDLFEALLAHSADAVLVATPEGAILRVNPAACAVLGGSEPEIARLGRAGIVVPSARADEMLAERDRTSTVRGEVLFRRVDGTPFLAEMTSTVIEAGAGERIVIVIFRDVSERHRIQDQLRESEERVRAQLAEIEAIYETAPVGLCVFDAELRWVRLNQRIAEINGVPIEAHIGKTPRDVVPDVGDQAEAALRRIVETGEPLLDFEMTGTTRAQPGVERAWSERWVPIKDERGRVTGISVAAEEITERKRAEAALRESEKRLRLALEATGLGIWEWDGRAGTVRWSDAIYEIAGVSRDGFDGRVGSFERLVHPDDAHVKAAADEALREGTPLAVEHRIVRPDGEVRWVATHGRAERDGDGNPVRMIGTIEDITDRKRAEEEVREGDRRKTDFLAVLSHELRNPLAPIRNSLYLLERTPAGSPPSIRARDVIRRQVDHVTKLVNDLLDVSRISHGKIALERTRLDARAVVRRACEDLRPSFEDRGVALTLDLASEPVWLDADETRLAQIVGNLLSNAVKFTPAAGAVDVTLRELSGRCELRVRDTGAGIEPHLLERIFEPFAQAERTRESARGGLGIGLALVKSLVTMHGGTVGAASAGVGRGAELRVSLPVAAAAREREPHPAAAPVPSLEILVVEDNLDAGQTLADLLELGGHRTRLAADGRAALAAFAESPPDVLICDVGLPDVSGYELVRRIRADATGRRPFAVALTGYAQPEDVERARAAGFDAHLAKPPPLERLEALLVEAATRSGEDRMEAARRSE